MCFNPTEIKLLNRLLCNHTINKFFLPRIKKVPNNTCDTCNEIEDNNHTFFKCSNFQNIRNKYKIFTLFNNLQEVLKSKKENYYKELLHFAKEINFEKPSTPTTDASTTSNA